MNYLSQYVGQLIAIELAANKLITGKLVEYGTNILVVFNGQYFFYIPVEHIICISKPDFTEDEIINIVPSPIKEDIDKMSLNKILDNAKGKFVEMYVTGNQSIYGFITQIQKDYFAFYSPVLKTILISTAHLKWIIPHLDKTPYSVDEKPLQLPSNFTLADTFEKQLKRLPGEVVFLDLGKKPTNVGLIKKIENDFVEIITVDGQTRYLNFAHIKTLHGIDLN